MRLKPSQEDGIEIFSLEGEIDMHYAPVLRSLLQGKIGERCPRLILDFSGVRFIDSMGLAAIIEYLRDASEYGGLLCIAGLSDSVRGIFEIVRLDRILPIFDTAAEARAALQAGAVAPTSPALFDHSDTR